MKTAEETVSHRPELSDRRIVDTPIGPVCMSKNEYALYQEELERRKAAAAFPE